MDAGQRTEVVAVVVVVVIPGIRGKSKKTGGHEKRYWTHKDQQQGGDWGVNVNYKHPQSISFTREDAMASSSLDTIRSEFSVTLSGEIFH